MLAVVFGAGFAFEMYDPLAQCGIRCQSGGISTDGTQGLQYDHEQALGLPQPWRTLDLPGR